MGGEVGQCEKANPYTLTAFVPDIIYDINQLQFLGAKAGSLTQEYIAVDANEAEPRKLRLGGFGATGVAKHAAGSLIGLRFQPLTGTTGRMAVFNLDDGLRGYAIHK